uniref:Ubiquitin carboxyl-terminal hydrolase n=1 Tax=Setaria digitata TaxID=48799 RepID=A0A915PV23_9BILA
MASAGIKSRSDNEGENSLLNKFMHKIGVEEGVECVDIYGFEEDVLAFIPRPCYAVILCFPMVDKVDQIMEPIYAKMKEEGSVVPDGVFFMKQKISNACGTFALIHSLANNHSKINLGNGSLKQWLDKAMTLSVEERSDSLAEDSTLAEAHDDCARSGETDSGSTVDHHFICYLNHKDELLELDSCAPSPRVCGSTSDATFLKDVGVSFKKLMEKLENDVSFSALAIVRAS